MDFLFLLIFICLMGGVVYFLKSGVISLRTLGQEDIWVAPIYALIAIIKIIGSLALLIAVLYMTTKDLVIKLF